MESILSKTRAEIQPLTKIDLFYLCAVSVLILFNLGIAFAVRAADLFFLTNARPLGVSFDSWLAILILGFITWSLDALDFFEKYTVASLLLVSGVWSNFLEKLFFEGVANYIHLGVIFVNFADLQIWLGLLILNVQIWFLNK